MAHAYKTMPSPVGDLKLVAGDTGLSAVLWGKDDPERVRLSPLVEDPDHPILREADRQLNDYFEGRRTAFDLPLDVVGTAFQTQVWEALVRIPFGETRTYGDIARAIGRPQAVRAVGAAAGRNPIAIVAPCHRVIGASGALTGFAGGVQAKVTLLRIEGMAYGADATFKSRARRAGAVQADLFSH